MTASDSNSAAMYLTAHKMFAALMSAANFVLAGSRRALSHEEKYEKAIEHSDFDFICIDNASNISFLEKQGFKLKSDINENYRDITTTGIYEKVIGEIVFQVAMKRQEHWSSLIKFWDFLADNPEVFVNSFWKRRVKKEDIRINIDFMITRVFNYG